MEENKPLSEATDIKEFKTLRAALKTAAAEPAVEKATQVEETKPVKDADTGPAEKEQQEKDTPIEKSVDDRIKELRGQNKHAAANKLEREAGAAEAKKTYEEETAKLKREIEALRSKPVETPKAETPKPATPQKDENAEPQVTDDKYAGTGGYDKYQRDIARWEARQAVREEMRQSEQSKAQATLRETLTKRMNEARTKYADFDAAVASDVKAGTGLILTPTMQQFVGESEVAMDVMYHLGKNHEDYVRIFMLPAGRQMAELGKLEAKVSTPEKAAPVTLKPAVSKVSAPPRVLSGADTPEPKSTSEATTLEEFKAIRRRLRAS